MPLVRLIFVAAALAGAVAEYIQERHRLSVIQGLPGREARDFYERSRDRRERVMATVTVVLALAAAAALFYTVRGAA